MTQRNAPRLFPNHSYRYGALRFYLSALAPILGHVLELKQRVRAYKRSLRQKRGVLRDYERTLRVMSANTPPAERPISALCARLAFGMRAPARGPRSSSLTSAEPAVPMMELLRECWTISSGGHAYKLCPFRNVTQIESSGASIRARLRPLVLPRGNFLSSSCRLSSFLSDC